jgi:putative sterol carrier protein
VSWQDWVDIVGNRLNPMRAFATGRLRPRGNPLALKRLVQVFPRD